MRGLAGPRTALRVSLTVAALSFALCDSAAQVASSGAVDDGGVLPRGSSVERRISSSARPVHTLTASAGEFVRIAITQRSFHLRATLRASDASVVAIAETPVVEGDPFELAFVSPRDGSYSLELNVLDKIATSGSYRIAIVESRPSRPEDASRVALERAVAESEQLYSEGTTASLAKAKERFATARDLATRLGDRAVETTVLLDLAELLGSTGELTTSTSLANEALALARQLNDRRREAFALYRIGRDETLMRRPAEALDRLTAALDIWRELHNDSQQASTLTGLCSANAALAQFDRALEGCAEALPYWRAAGDSLGEAMALNNIGNIHQSVGDYEGARTYFEQAWPPFHAAQLFRSEAVILNNVGLANAALGKPDAALDYYQRSVAMARDAGNARGVAMTLHNMGLSHAELRQYDKALDVYRAALDAFDAIGDVVDTIDTLNQIGRIDVVRKEPERALEPIALAIERSRTLGARMPEAFALTFRARAERDLGRLDAAKASIEHALALTESQRRAVSGPTLRSAYLAMVHARYGLLVDILMQQRAASDAAVAEAFGVSERGRARTLLELLTAAHADIREGVDRELLDRERTIGTALDRAAAERLRVAATKAAPADIAKADEDVRRLDAQFHDVEAQIQSRSPRYASLVQPQPLTVTDLQRDLLDPDTVLLEYALAEDRSYVWAVTSQRVEAHELPPEAAIESLVNRVYEAWSRPGAPSAHSAAKTLSAMLLGPVAGSIAGRRVVIVPDAALQYLPFAALPEPASPAAPLAARHEIVVAPSATALALLRRDASARTPAAKQVLVVADPVFDRRDPRVTDSRAPNRTTLAEATLVRSGHESGVLSFERLRFSRSEADAILSLVPDGQGRKVTDFDATRAALFADEVRDYRVIHLATHGLVNAQHPESSGLVFSLVDRTGQAVNGFLPAHEMYNLRLGADLVVLSACQTALGQDVRGEGLIGMTRAFMYAGAPRVVASLWTVPDRATAELMARFYENLLHKHMRAAAALRAAQLDLRSSTRWSQPYYWAGFVLQGEWR